MGERKVQNKYYPPDFDPDKLKGPKAKKEPGLTPIRMMMPVTIRCDCGHFMMAGKKCYAKKETVKDQDYLGVKMFRFYMKCPTCGGQFTIRTDPENADYVAEWGCKRNFEPWKKAKDALEETNKAKAVDESANAFKALENRTIQSQKEMAALDRLGEIRAMNAANARISVDDMLDVYKKQDEVVLTEVRDEFRRAREDRERAEERDEEDEEDRLERLIKEKREQKKRDRSDNQGQCDQKRSKVEETGEEGKGVMEGKEEGKTGLSHHTSTATSLLMGYGSDSSSSSG